MKVILTSISTIKSDALRRWLEKYVAKHMIDIYACKCNVNTPSQPTEKSYQECVMARILNYISSDDSEKKNKKLIVSIENYIDETDQKDYCCVCVSYGETNIFSKSFGIDVPQKYFDEMQKQSKHEIYYGYNKTAGRLISEATGVPADNWMKYVAGIDRVDQIYSAFENLDFRPILSAGFDMYPDYPKDGVNFEDIMPIFRNPLFSNLMLEYATKFVDKPDIIIGPESRGAMLGAMLATHLKCSFIPLRKIGKLPGKLHSVYYGTEYKDENVLEVQVQDWTGLTIYVFDDVVATGGSVEACVKLVELNNGKVKGIITVKDIAFFKDHVKELFGKYGVDVSVILP
jgi:adenine phosphoribosyltransferase